MLLGPHGAEFGPNRNIMIDPIQLLKSHARVLHRAAQAGEPQVLARHRRLPELRGVEEDALVAALLRRHSLALIALELGFRGWAHAAQVIRGERDEGFGTLLCPSRCYAHSNIWSASYEEAKAIRSEHGGFLLGYRDQCLIVDRYFIETLGLDPEDPGWAAIGRDWVRPADPTVRTRFYGELLALRFGDAALLAA